MPLTGRFTFRRTLWGKIVLQVEEEVRPIWRFWRKDARRLRWRDATLMDLTQVELRPLMDLRFRPRLDWERLYSPRREEPLVTAPPRPQEPRGSAPANDAWPHRPVEDAARSGQRPRVAA